MIKIEAGVMAAAGLFAAYKNDGSRPSLDGVCLDISKDGTVVAVGVAGDTTGLIAARSRVENDGPGWAGSVPCRLALKISKSEALWLGARKRRNEIMEILFFESGKYWAGTVGERRIVGIVQDEKFPKWRRMFDCKPVPAEISQVAFSADLLAVVAKANTFLNVSATMNMTPGMTPTTTDGDRAERSPWIVEYCDDAWGVVMPARGMPARRPPSFLRP